MYLFIIRLAFLVYFFNFAIIHGNLETHESESKTEMYSYF